MSVVVPFPGMRTASRGGQRNRNYLTVSSGHPTRGGSLLSWVSPATCECCGRPTLAGPKGLDRTTLCRHCSPPNIA
jgi:hypothetical protein